MEKPVSIFELVAKEREFLHDLANPLAVATGMLEAYREELKRSNVAMTEPLTRKLGKLEAALDRIGGLLTDHREKLMAIQAAHSKE